MFKHRKLIVSIVAGVIVLAMVVSLIASLAFSVSAASSGAIRSQIDALQTQKEQIRQKKQELQQDIEANKSQTQDVVDKKIDLDQQIELTQEDIDNQTELLQQYNLLIAEKQSELDDALEHQKKLNEQYQQRLRAMEENGGISYWSILFKANSFSDLLDRLDMIREIAAADQLMLENLQQVASQIETERADLETERAAQEEAKQELDRQQQTLADQREQSDALIQELYEDTVTMQQKSDEYDAMEEELLDQIAAKEQEYTKQRAAEQAAAAAAAAAPSGGSAGASTSAPAASGFLYPLPSRVPVSSAYGYRLHPTTKKYSFHNGVDLAAGAGTPIYATKSGTVTTATYSNVYGWYVVINHGDGFSSLYGHMTRYVVSAGQQVSQGQVIGYVGSTGWSTGNHLHFTIFYNGGTVNPMAYV